MSPTRRALLALAAWCALGAAASWDPAWREAWLGAGAGLALLAGVDALRLLATPAPRVERRVAPAISMGVWTPVAIDLESRAARRLALRVFDHHPVGLAAAGLPLALELEPGARVEHGYRVRPDARGDHAFGRVELRLASPWGLLERHRWAGEEQGVRVYPNFRAAVRYELMAVENRAGAVGIRRRPRRGEGLDFHELREYRAGDSLRQIDWKATARARRAISREYQDQRDQQILFLLDCGRRMHSRDGDRSHFDAALDAMLLTAHVASRQGDAFGLMTFSGERRWLAPRKGVAHLNALLNAVYDLETAPRASDFGAAARDLAVRVRKRSLVVLLSNLRDDDVFELAPALRLLATRHLVLLVSLVEGVLAEVLRAPLHDLEDALRVGSVRRYQELRARTLQALSRSGAILLDAEAAALPVVLANRYLDIKAAGVL